MSYDVIVTETVGEISKEYKFKDYRDFLDWELRGKEVNKDCTNLLTKIEVPEIEDELIRLTRENALELISVGDTIVSNKLSLEAKEWFTTDTYYTVESINPEHNDALCCNGYYISFSDEQSEIYKVIKN